MTETEKILWKKIASFEIDVENSALKFSARLARENGWSISHSKAVVDEYKKFIFLSVISDTHVTPSDQVDQAWHLHLTYTKSYWIELCENTLQKRVHHNPTKGGKKEREKFDDYYTQTLKLYRETFKSNPPKNIWPDNEVRFSDINFRRVNLKNYWLIRRPALGKSSVAIIVALLLSFFLIQSQAHDGAGPVIGILFCIVIVIWSIFKDKNDNSGCSGSGCGSNSGCSGCGGDSGCSGCGGGCGD